MKAIARLDSGRAGSGGLWLHTIVTTASGITFKAEHCSEEEEGSSTMALSSK